MVYYSALHHAAKAKKSEEKAAEYLQQVSNKVTAIEGSIGDIGFAPLGIDETQNKRRYLNGQVISQAQFVSFTNKIKAAIQLTPSLATSETNWQAEVTNSPYGICGKFVIDDTLGTIRLPKYPDWSIREVGQAPVVGNGMTLGLTAGTETDAGFAVDSTSYNLRPQTGAFGKTLPDTYTDGNPYANGTLVGITTDPLKSGVIADLVNANTEDKLQGKWFIQVATGTEESVDVTREIELNNPFFFGMSQYFESEPKNISWLISNGSFHSGATYVSFYEWLLKIYNGTEIVDGVSVKASTDTYDDYDYVINTADTTFRLPIRTTSDYVVKSKEATAEDSSWYRVYKSGWVEQGSRISVRGDGQVTVTLLKEMADDKYYANWISAQGHTDSGTGTRAADTLTTTTFRVLNMADATMLANWYVCGQGAEIPQSRIYFYVGETIQDANVVNASGVLTRVAELSDSYISGLGMPDYSAGVNITSLPYIAPVDGLISILGQVNNSTAVLKLNDEPMLLIDTATNIVAVRDIRVKKGDVLDKLYVTGTVPYNNTDRNEYSMFYPLKGVS